MIILLGRIFRGILDRVLIECWLIVRLWWCGSLGSRCYCLVVLLVFPATIEPCRVMLHDLCLKVIENSAYAVLQVGWSQIRHHSRANFSSSCLAIKDYYYPHLAAKPFYLF